MSPMRAEAREILHCTAIAWKDEAELGSLGRSRDADYEVGMQVKRRHSMTCGSAMPPALRS